MIQWFSDRVSDHFNKLLLALLFTVTVVICVHLMHKADAGGQDANFIVWAEAQATFILGRLVGMIAPDQSQAAGATKIIEHKEP